MSLEKKIALIGESVGIETSITDHAKPSVLLTRPLNEIAGEMGALAHRSQLYRQGERYVTVDPKTGDVRGMLAGSLLQFRRDVGSTREAWR
ncbi:MAG: hypothetical protein R3F19_27010 [Verrucomicrobiales bacterium]